MMMFCPKCGALLRVRQEDEKKVMFCVCGYTTGKVEAAIKESVKSKQDLNIIEKDDTAEALPVVSAECPKCGNGQARFWTLQTRASDEPETKFFRCVKCEHTWRDYS